MEKDPRQPLRIRKYSEKSVEDEATSNWMNLLSLMMGGVGLMMRYRWAVWASLLAALASITNAKRSERDVKQQIITVMYEESN